MFDIPWTLWLVLAPLAAGAVALLVRGQTSQVLGAILGPLHLAAAGLVAWQVWREGPLLYDLAGWGAPLGIRLAVDGLSAMMLLMTAAVAATISLNALDYFADPQPAEAPQQPPGEAPQAGSERAHHEDRAAQRRYFWPLWLVLIAALNALFVSSDVFNLYVTLELVTLTSVPLAGLANSREALEAALRYLLVALAGSLAFLLGVSFLYAAHGTLDLTLLAERIAARSDTMTVVAAAAITIGLAAKGALFPLHFWLPAAHANAPAPVSAALSGLVVTAAFYVLLRLWHSIFPAPFIPSAGMLLGGLGAAAIVWGSIQALLTPRLKLLIAYSTVAQLGYLFLSFALQPSLGGAEAFRGAVLFAVAHACAKGGMFLAAGQIAHLAGHDRLVELPALAWRTPLSYLTLAVSAMTLLGLPPSGGYAGKHELLAGALDHQTWVSIVVYGGSLLAAGYMIRAIASGFRSGQDATSSAAPMVDGSPTERIRLADLPPLLLALASVLLGFASTQVEHLLAIGAMPK